MVLEANRPPRQYEDFNVERSAVCKKCGWTGTKSQKIKVPIPFGSAEKDPEGALGVYHIANTSTRLDQALQGQHDQRTTGFFIGRVTICTNPLDFS